MGKHIVLNLYWLGIHTASGILTPILLPYLVTLFMPPEQKNTALAVLRTVGLAVAMLTQPIAGMLSDRSRSRFGRRRPFIAVSALGSAAALVAVAAARSYPALLAAMALLQLASNVGQSAVQGLIPDLVPPDQRGRSSGVKSVLELLPVFLIIFIGPLVDQGRVGLVTGIIAAGYLLTALVTLLGVRELPLRAAPAPLRAGPVARSFALTGLFVLVTQAVIAVVRVCGAWLHASGWSLAAQAVGIGMVGLAGMAAAIGLGVTLGVRVGLGPQARQHGAFIGWVVNRLMFLAAVGSVEGFLLYYLKDALHIPNAAAMTTRLLAAVSVFLLPAALAGGALADRVGKRPLVRAAGGIAALGTLLLLFAQSMPVVIASGCIIGLGAGIFMATNWALGADLVPPDEAGRYLGISNLAGAGAGIVGAGIGGPLADAFNLLQPGLGYTVIFGIYAGLFVLSVVVLGEEG